MSGTRTADDIKDVELTVKSEKKGGANLGGVVVILSILTLLLLGVSAALAIYLVYSSGPSAVVTCEVTPSPAPLPPPSASTTTAVTSAETSTESAPPPSPPGAAPPPSPRPWMPPPAASPGLTLSGGGPTTSAVTGGPSPSPSPSTLDGCSISVIGAGAGGLYTAFRLVVDAGVAASSVCIFEADARIGGRILSLRNLGPRGDLTVDAGGYRTFDTISPRTQYLIESRLNLTLGCYDPVSCLGKVIVDSTGKRIGYQTFLDTMRDILVERGIRLYLSHPLTSIEKLGSAAGGRRLDAASNIRLHFAKNGGLTVDSGRLMLTLPQYPLFTILRNSPTISVPAEVTSALHALQPVFAVKLYLYYADAFWKTQLGHLEGEFTSTGNAVSPPLQGRYHDGDIVCDDAAGTVCHGYLQTQYFWDFSGRTQNYFSRFQADRESVVTYLNQTADGHIVLSDVHEEVLAYHGLNGTAAGAAIPAPEDGVLVTYNLATPHAQAAWHYWTDATKVSVLETALEAENMHLIDEAFSPSPSWAEGAIYLADNLMTRLYNLPPPHASIEYLASSYRSEAWNDAPVSLGPPPLCSNTCMRNGNGVATFVANGACNDGGPDAGLTTVCDFGTDCADCGPRSVYDAPGASNFGEDPACFGGDALLLLANGSRIALKHAAVGMRVGSALGAGKITQVLTHPIHKPVKHFTLDVSKPRGVVSGVASTAADMLRLAMGEGGLPTIPAAAADATLKHAAPLVGTLDHPVYADGAWREARDAIADGALDAHGHFAEKLSHVDVLYNLEIDGDQPHAKLPHAYDVHGLTVSGLGDHALLNRLYPRQKAFMHPPQVLAADTLAAAATADEEAPTAPTMLGGDAVMSTSATGLAATALAQELKTGERLVMSSLSSLPSHLAAMTAASSAPIHNMMAQVRAAAKPAAAPVISYEVLAHSAARRLSAGGSDDCDEALCGDSDVYISASLSLCDEALCGDDEYPPPAASETECDAALCGATYPPVDDPYECEDALCGDDDAWPPQGSYSDPCDDALCGEDDDWPPADTSGCEDALCGDEDDWPPSTGDACEDALCGDDSMWPPGSNACEDALCGTGPNPYTEEDACETALCGLTGPYVDPDGCEGALCGTDYPPGAADACDDALCGDALYDACDVALCAAVYDDDGCDAALCPETGTTEDTSFRTAAVAFVVIVALLVLALIGGLVVYGLRGSKGAGADATAVSTTTNRFEGIDTASSVTTVEGGRTAADDDVEGGAKESGGDEKGEISTAPVEIAVEKI